MIPATHTTSAHCLQDQMHGVSSILCHVSDLVMMVIASFIDLEASVELCFGIL